MDFSFVQALQPNAFRSQTGMASGGEIAELQKALTAGYGTDVAQLNGGGALRIQSLDRTMKTTIQENKHFVLFNEMQKTNATATVDEWTEQSSIGAFLGASTNSELGQLNQFQGAYNRRVGQVKYLMTRREVSYVESIQNNIVSALAVEQTNGALQLLTDAEFLSFEGDSTVVPTEFDGIYAQMVALGLSDHIIDMRADVLNGIDKINQAAALIAGYGNFGTPTHLFTSQQVQADFNIGLDPAFRVPLTSVPNGGIQLGAPVNGIRTSWGDVKNAPDVFIRDNVPSQHGVFETNFPAIAQANAFGPASVTVAAAATYAGSLFATAQAGNYYYAITGVNANGESVSTVTAQVAVVAGGAAVLTINRSVTQQETGYVIYRSRLNGTNQIADMRFMVRVPASGGATTVYNDYNQHVPGTTKAYMLNMMAGGDAIAWRQYLPMTKFPLYPTNTVTVPWAQLLFGYLRIAKRRQHVVFDNILPSSATWRPFNV